MGNIFKSFAYKVKPADNEFDYNTTDVTPPSFKTDINFAVPRIYKASEAHEKKIDEKNKDGRKKRSSKKKRSKTNLKR